MESSEDAFDDRDMDRPSLDALEEVSNEKPNWESASEDLEMPEDPVRMYLREIGRMWRSAISRCFGLATTMSAGRRWEKVPTSRAVPHADG